MMNTTAPGQLLHEMERKKMISGCEVRWCHHCQQWNRTHFTRDHRVPKRDSGGNLITPEQSQTSADKAKQQSLSDIASSSALSTIPTLPSATGSLASTSNTLRR